MRWEGDDLITCTRCGCFAAIQPSVVHRPLTDIPVCIGNLLAPCLFNQCLPHLQTIGL